ncbi:MAG: undecaprenyl-diphosphate phosphatase [Nanoarchaeota archaeon]|nr:undecaprenyl-diphosphate phosphatase [Nanoarchaeota archaeon]
MVSVLQAIILGILQGVTEWLPISSSGHLVIFQTILGVEQPIALDVALHFASLFVIVIFFRKRIAELCKKLLKFDRASMRYTAWLLIATLPVAAVGLLYKDVIESAFTSPRTVGAGLLFTGFLLLASRIRFMTGKLDTFKASIIGVFQAIAVFPGISRSGSTIASGLMLGVKREEAAEFSFLLAFPAILGASILEYEAVLHSPDILALGAGMAVTIITGLITLPILMGIIKKDHFHYFGIYCLAVGILTLIFMH